MDPDKANTLKRRRSVRATTTLVAVGVVALFLAVGAVILIWQTRIRIEESIIDAASERAISLAIDAGRATEGFSPAASELVAQLVGSDGELLASSQTAALMPPFVEVDLEPGSSVVLRVESLVPGLGDVNAFDQDEGPFVVVARGVALEDGTGAVLVAASLDNAAEAVQQAVPLLAIGLPILVVVVGGLTWLLTGRALAPVEQMRLQAGEISARELHRRLPVPATRDELERLATTLNEMLARLEISVLRQRRFVADASHELKSPLATLRTMIDVGERHPDSPAEARFAADLRPEIERMQRLVDDLLVLARYEENPWTGEKVEVQLDRVVMAEADLLARRGLIVVHTGGVDPAVVQGDALRLGQLVRNLTDNAARHAANKVWLALSATDGMVEFLVSDDGPGIPEEDRERVFDRFVRLDDSRSRGEGGSGLGLALARSIARSHGGEVTIVASHHGGATLLARLPKLS